MSGNSKVNLPTYIKDGGFETQEDFFQLMTLILTDWFNSNGFFLPSLTDAEVTKLLTLTPTPKQRIWINSTINKIQFLDTTGTLQVVTSV